MVVGTGTDIGKTWIAARLLRDLRAAGVTVAARKPAQSFDPGDAGETRDAAVLAAASGEAPETVCPRHRWYETAMAPPMAAAALGRGAFTIRDLIAELAWPSPDGVDVGVVETAGGVRSPIAEDGDCADLLEALDPDLAVLVADAGLGTINSVRLAVATIPSEVPVVVVLNRFDSTIELQARNRDWLRERNGLRVLVFPGEEERLVSLVRGGS